MPHLPSPVLNLIVRFYLEERREHLSRKPWYDLRQCAENEGRPRILPLLLTDKTVLSHAIPILYRHVKIHGEQAFRSFLCYVNLDSLKYIITLQADRGWTKQVATLAISDACETLERRLASRVKEGGGREEGLYPVEACIINTEWTLLPYCRLAAILKAKTVKFTIGYPFGLKEPLTDYQSLSHFRLTFSDAVIKHMGTLHLIIDVLPDFLQWAAQYQRAVLPGSATREIRASLGTRSYIDTFEAWSYPQFSPDVIGTGGYNATPLVLLQMMSPEDPYDGRWSAIKLLRKLVAKDKVRLKVKVERPHAMCGAGESAQQGVDLVKECEGHAGSCEVEMTPQENAFAECFTCSLAELDEVESKWRRQLELEEFREIL